MTKSGRRAFLEASTGTVLLAAKAAHAELPVPPALGRTHHDPGRRRRVLYDLLGDLPDRQRPISAHKRDEQPRDGYLLETWELDLNGLEPVPALLAKPSTSEGGAASHPPGTPPPLRRSESGSAASLSPRRLPAVLFNHSHGGGYDIGKREFVDGRPYLQPPPYAKALTGAGYVALSIDHWCFGARSHTSELDTVKAMLWQGRVLWGMMVYDSLRALDWLAARPDVDASRLGTLGMSMGSTMAQWVGALDERVKATVDICCLTEYHTLLAKKGLGGHGIYYYVPGLLKHFTAADVNALMAPRAHLALAGVQDKLAPVEGLDIIERELKQVYAEASHPERFKLLRYDVGHQETAEGRTEALAFLRTFL